MKKSYVYSALIAAVNIAIAKADSEGSQNTHERCYGIAKAGENECGGWDKNGEMHSCPSWSTVDNDPYAWVYVKKGTCSGRGGKLRPPPRPPEKPEL